MMAAGRNVKELLDSAICEIDKTGYRVVAINLSPDDHAALMEELPEQLFVGLGTMRKYKDIPVSVAKDGTSILIAERTSVILPEEATAGEGLIARVCEAIDEMYLAVKENPDRLGMEKEKLKRKVDELVMHVVNL